MPEPTWTTPARINGLPAPSRKRRAETTKDGTMAELVEMWLQLADHDKRNCDIGWGPDASGNHGTMGAETIARYVERNGLPPAMAARCKNSAAMLARMLKIPEPEFKWPNASSFADGSGTGQQRDKTKAP